MKSGFTILLMLYQFEVVKLDVFGDDVYDYSRKSYEYIIDDFGESMEYWENTWKMLKEDSPIKNMTFLHIKRMGDGICVISDADILELPLVNPKMVNYLGQRNCKKRIMGLLAYSLRLQWGDEHIWTEGGLNTVGGIICGFPENMFLKLATKYTSYGPIEQWSFTTVAVMGLVLKALRCKELQTVRSSAMVGMSPIILDKLHKWQFKCFTESQIQHFNTHTAMVYYRIIEGFSGCPSYKPFQFVFICSLTILLM